MLKRSIIEVYGADNEVAHRQLEYARSLQNCQPDKLLTKELAQDEKLLAVYHKILAAPRLVQLISEEYIWFNRACWQDGVCRMDPHVNNTLCWFRDTIREQLNLSGEDVQVFHEFMSTKRQKD